LLTDPTLDQLGATGLHGMAKAFRDLAASAEADTLGHGDWLALLLDREGVHRQDKRLGARLRHVRLVVRRRPRISTVRPREGSTGP
jgi:hypothetical protein